MPEARKPRAVGFNHVAIEAGDIDEALAFYGRLLEFKLRDKSKDAAFIDLGDELLALHSIADAAESRHSYVQLRGNATDRTAFNEFCPANGHLNKPRFYLIEDLAYVFGLSEISDTCVSAMH